MKASILLSLVVSIGLSGDLHYAAADMTTTRNSRDIGFPVVRFRLWDDLTTQQQDVATNTLGYSEFSWNRPGRHPIEGVSFAEQPPTMQQAIVETLAMTADQWDCWMTHYENPQMYTWNDLQTLGIQEYFVTLGFANAEEWTPPTRTVPAVYFFSDWEDLTPIQQEAAMELCWLEETWNGYDLEEWRTRLPTEVPSVSPTPSMAPVVLQERSQTQQTAPPSSGRGMATVIPLLLLGMQVLHFFL